jgi:hypothetical protein
VPDDRYGPDVSQHTEDLPAQEMGRPAAAFFSWQRPKVTRPHLAHGYLP